jgi:hypothetical protein
MWITALPGQWVFWMSQIPRLLRPVGELDAPKQEAGGKLTAVVGTAALLTSAPSAPTEQTTTQTVTVLSFADTEHPSVARQFPGVTSMLKDDSRGLIYLAGSDGLWVLRMEPARDTQLEKEYAHYVIYDHYPPNLLGGQFCPPGL